MNKEDVFIQSQVEDTIKNTRFLHNADINIETRNGEVTLFGFVDVLAEKWAAGKIVQMIPGVISVDNSLTVAMDRQLKDSSITEMIQERLNANQLASVTATAKEGTAYLEGRTETLAAEEDAKEFAARVPGVKEVISYIRFEQGDFYTDDASKCFVVDGTAFLDGVVGNPDQKEKAEEVVSSFVGVET